MEKSLFVMPDDGEAFLAALAAVQAWIREQDEQIENALSQIGRVEVEADQSFGEKKINFGRYQMFKDQCKQARAAQDARRYDVQINCSEDKVFYCHGLKARVVANCQPQRGEFDLIYRFDPEHAYALAKTTERHMASAFAMLIGAETGSLPDLSNLEPAFCEIEAAGQITDVLLLPWPGRSQVFEFVTKNNPTLEVCEMDSTDPGLFIEVWRSDMVVGPRSVGTYIASALGRRVVELYPDDRYRRWLSKWDNPNYSMIYGSEFPPALVYRAMTQLWDRPVQELKRNQPRELLRKRTSMAGLGVAAAEGSL